MYVRYHLLIAGSRETPKSESVGGLDVECLKCDHINQSLSGVRASVKPVSHARPTGALGNKSPVSNFSRGNPVRLEIDVVQFYKGNGNFYMGI